MTEEQLKRGLELRDAMSALEPTAATVCEACNRHALPSEIVYSDGARALLDDLSEPERERMGNAICTLVRGEYERIGQEFREL